MARDAIADIAHVNPGYEPGRFPIVAAVELPFLFSNAKEGSAALDAWYRRYAEREMKDVRYCLAFAHDPGSFHFTRKKVVMPADVSGLKVRPPNAVIASWMRGIWGRSAFRPPRRKSATCWRRASPTRPARRGDRCSCSGSTRSRSITSTLRSTSRSRSGS
jgi:hypothetical protein